MPFECKINLVNNSWCWRRVGTSCACPLPFLNPSLFFHHFVSHTDTEASMHEWINTIQSLIDTAPPETKPRTETFRRKALQDTLRSVAAFFLLSQHSASTRTRCLSFENRRLIDPKDSSVGETEEQILQNVVEIRKAYPVRLHRCTHLIWTI
jgi:hypothetical protein